MGKCTDGTRVEQRGVGRGGDKDVAMFLKVWVGYSLTEHIAKAKHTHVAQAGAVVTAVAWVRERGSVKNWCALLTAAEQRQEQEAGEAEMMLDFSK